MASHKGDVQTVLISGVVFWKINPETKIISPQIEAICATSCAASPLFFNVSSCSSIFFANVLPLDGICIMYSSAFVLAIHITEALPPVLGYRPGSHDFYPSF